MSDARLTPDPGRITRRDPAQVGLALVDLCRAPDGPRDRQLLLGAEVTVFEDAQGWAYVQAQRDGYCGFVPSMALTRPAQATHVVTAPATHSYLRPDMKSPDRMHLSLGAHLTARAQGDDFIDTPQGFVPRQHIAALPHVAPDPVSVAEEFLGTPYLWGGNSRLGIDCSGLVQVACHAAGIDCRGDSDLQETALGHPVPDGQNPRRGDLLFWKGHVAWVADTNRLLHANAFAMATTYEPIKDAIKRIAAQNGGPVTAHRRLPALPIG